MLADRHAAPLRGALFDQLVKELRSEYAAAVTACAQRIHRALADRRRSIRLALDKYGVSGDPGVMQEQARLSCMLVLHVGIVCELHLHLCQRERDATVRSAKGFRQAAGVIMCHCVSLHVSLCVITCHYVSLCVMDTVPFMDASLQ